MKDWLKEMQVRHDEFYHRIQDERDSLPDWRKQEVVDLVLTPDEKKEYKILRDILHFYYRECPEG